MTVGRPAESPAPGWRGASRSELEGAMMRPGLLRSKKFWLGVLTFVAHVLAAALGVEVPVFASAGLLGALGAEGLADVAGAIAGAKYRQS